MTKKLVKQISLDRTHMNDFCNPYMRTIQLFELFENSMNI